MGINFKKIIKLSLVMLLCLWPALLLAGEMALGVSEQSDRRQAVSQASRQAMAQLLLQKASQRLSAADLTDNWNQIHQQVLSRPEAYIKNFRNLAVSHQGGQTWVLVEAQTDDSALEQLLNTWAGRTAQPTAQSILSLVSEDVAPGRPPLYWWSAQPGLAICPARIERGLKNLNYVPFDPSRLLSSLKPEITGNVVLTEQQAHALGQQAGVKLALWGRLRAYPILSQSASPSTPLLQMALLDVQRKRILAQVEVEGAVFKSQLPEGFEESMDKEVAEALAKLFELAGIKVTQMRVVMEVEGLSNAGELARLERALVRMDGLVIRVQRQSLSPGQATLLLDTAQDGLALAEKLEGLNEPNWQFTILEKTARRLRVSPAANAAPR